MRFFCIDPRLMREMVYADRSWRDTFLVSAEVPVRLASTHLDQDGGTVRGLNKVSELLVTARVVRVHRH